ncbi:MAG TPA: SCO family protein [Candidatus Krumholzibacteria bacterium]
MRGTHVPDVALIGEDSTTFTLASLAGKPVVINPIFTTCQSTCPMITASLRDALAGIGEPGVGYHVLTFSFDPADGPAALRDYRSRVGLPAGWTLAVATEENRKRLLDAIDFHVEALPDGGFVHPNAVVILTPTLVVSSYAHGVSFDAKDLRKRMEVATQEASFVRHYRPYIVAVAIIAWLSVVAVLYATRKKKRAATQPGT